MEGGSISNRLFYCYTVSFYEKEYCLFSFFLYLSKRDYLLLKTATSGLLPMSVALIASAALFMMNREYFMDYKSIGIFEAAFWGTWKWNLHPILLICLAGVVGLLLY